MAKEPIPPPSKHLVRVGKGVSSKPRNFAKPKPPPAMFDKPGSTFLYVERAGVTNQNHTTSQGDHGQARGLSLRTPPRSALIARLPVCGLTLPFPRSGT